MGSMKPLADHCLLGKLALGVSVDWKIDGWESAVIPDSLRRSFCLPCLSGEGERV